MKLFSFFFFFLQACCHTGTGRERTTPFKASVERGQHGREQSITQPVASSSLSTSSWDSDEGLRNPGWDAGGFCAQQWPHSPAPKGAAAGTTPFRAESSCPALQQCLLGPCLQTSWKKSLPSSLPVQSLGHFSLEVRRSLETHPAQLGPLCNMAAN